MNIQFFLGITAACVFIFLIGIALGVWITIEITNTWIPVESYNRREGDELLLDTGKDYIRARILRDSTYTKNIILKIVPERYDFSLFSVKRIMILTRN